MKKTTKEQYMKYGSLAAILLAAVLLVFAFSLVFTEARYVTEIEGTGDDLSYETQQPFDVGSQQELFNAIKSGYGYVKLSDDLKAPIIMTGDSLDLKRDLTIDLNGNEIERNNRSSLLNVPSDTTFTVIDTRGGGGLYNPIGSVLTVTGGNLNVYGGMFESGPRPAEYYSTLVKSESYSLDYGEVTAVETSGGVTDLNTIMPRLSVRTSGASPNSGNVYFDVDIVYGGKTLIKRDTYCYVAVSGATDDSFDTFDVKSASFAYTYYVNSVGQPTDDTSAEGVHQVMLFGYENDIAYSVAQTIDGIDTPAPNYAAVDMSSGSLNINVISTSGVGERNRTAGSFYSYFGTWQTSCVYITGGTMTVSTSGELKTVDPDELPAIDAAVDTPNNSAKYGESACILSDGGMLDFKRVQSATSYNGSVVSVSGGAVIMNNVNILKKATVSHADSPFDVADEPDDTGSVTVFPRGRQYRDAAIFVNGGTLDITQSSVVVEKNIAEGVSKNRTDGKYKTTFGILSRGRSSAKSNLDGDGTTIQMYGSHSYGVFGTRGTINLKNGHIKLDSDSYNYGVYAVNKAQVAANSVDIELKNTDITLGNATENGTYTGALPNTDWVDANGNTVAGEGTSNFYKAASVGVYLDSSEYVGGRVTMDNSNISSQEMGVAVNGGNLSFVNGGAISAYNASAIYLDGGNIMFGNNDNGSLGSYDIICRINRKGAGSTSCTANASVAKDAGAHSYRLFVPWQKVTENGITTVKEYDNEHGICVVGGSLQSTARFNIDFRGLYNGYDQYASTGDNFNKTVIKSFAVACMQQSVVKDEDVLANINIKYANITSSVGGGVKVQGGAVVLGDENSRIEDITVNTTGRVHTDTAYKVSDSNAADTWKFYATLSGGHAVIARGGSMKIYNGSFTAAFCNGIAATNDGNTSHTEIDIYDGVFKGNLTHDAGATPQYQTATGPESHYGLKVMGDATVNIYGGVFDGKNGGAMVRGSSVSSIAEVKIHAGTFGKAEMSLQVDGQDGFNIYEYSSVYFGAKSQSELEGMTDAQKQSLINVYANLFPIAVNPLIADSDSSVRVYIFYGTYNIRNTDRSYPSANASNLAISAVSPNMNDVEFRIFGMGSHVYDEKFVHGSATTRRYWLNAARIRCSSQADAVISEYAINARINYFSQYSDVGTDKVNISTSIERAPKYYVDGVDVYGYDGNGIDDSYYKAANGFYEKYVNS